MNKTMNDVDLSGLMKKALDRYAIGVHYDNLIKAKEQYFGVTGRVIDDDEDYESRMNFFNDWYLLQFTPESKKNILMKDYLLDKKIDKDILKAFLNVNFSIFEYRGEGFFGGLYLYDILHKKKVALCKGHHRPGLLKDDLFIGRVIYINRDAYLLANVSMLPKEIKKILFKESRNIRKFKSSSVEVDFLMKLETLKTKWKRYGHIQADKIFTFR